MNKINFKNGQAPYISDVNLNKIQDNVEQEIQNLSDTVQDILDKIVTQTATQETNGLMSKEDKVNLDKCVEGWKLHKEVMGSQLINIADLEFTELLIVAEFYTEDNYMLGSSLVLPKEILTESLEYYDMGSYVSLIRMGVSKTSLVLNMAVAYNKSYSNTIDIKVFYK